MRVPKKPPGKTLYVNEPVETVGAALTWCAVNGIDPRNVHLEATEGHAVVLVYDGENPRHAEQLAVYLENLAAYTSWYEETQGARKARVEAAKKAPK